MQSHLASPAARTTAAAVEKYLNTVLDELRTRAAFDSTLASPNPSQSIFELLTNRRYGHVGRRRSEKYRESVCLTLEREVTSAAPVRFFYDLGPGYHASLHVESGSLSFDVGLGELLALHMVISFCNELQAIYEPGVRFHLVIDDLCGWATNDVPLEKLEEYTNRLRQLILSVGAGDLVKVLAESENTDRYEYSARLDELAVSVSTIAPSDDEIENVARFLGRVCSPTEAAERIARYERTTTVTEEFLASAIEGVRLTQRAGESTLGFRAFAGTDQRIQVGQTAFTSRVGGGIKPILLTSRNVDRFELLEFDDIDILPRPMTRVTYADPL